MTIKNKINFSRGKINPIDMIMKLCKHMEIDKKHIIYDPSINILNQQYSIIRTNRHDGTLCFTHDLIISALLPLIYQQSYFKPDNPNFEKIKGIKYRIGKIFLSSVFPIKIERENGFSFVGIRERIRIPVIIEQYMY